jgi:phenylacetic acid degradation operon negative regulatory protein
VFDISEPSARVALTRLSAAGLIESAGRGSYRLGCSAQTVAREVGSWRDVERKVRAWNGTYVCAHVEAAVALDRAEAKRRLRALHLVGLRELGRGLWIRPDNLEGSVDAIRERLARLGAAVTVFAAQGFDAETEARIPGLWDRKKLDLSYRKSRELLTGWLEQASALDDEAAARESFLLGGAAIRQIVFDPLLPSPFVDTAARRAFVDTMRSFDRVGRSIWQRTFGLKVGAPSAPEGWVQ